MQKDLNSVRDWVQTDPWFINLPPKEKQATLNNYFDAELADDWFKGLDPETQAKTKENFFNYIGLESMEPKQAASPKSDPSPPSTLSEAGKGVASWATRLPETVNIGLRYVGERMKDGWLEKRIPIGGGRTVADLGADWAKIGKIGADYWHKKQEPFQQDERYRGRNVVDDLWMMKELPWWSYHVSQMAGDLGTAIVPAAGAGKMIAQVGTQSLKLAPHVVKNLSAIGAALTGGTVGSSLEATQTYQDVLNETGDEKQAARASEMMFGSVIALNTLSAGKILDKVGRGLANKITKTMGAGAVESISEGAEEPAEVASKIGAKLVQGEELPEGIPEMFLDSLKAAATVMGPAFVTGGGAAATTTMFDQQPPVTSDPVINDALKKGAEAAIQQDPITQEYKAYLDSGKATVEGLQALKSSVPEGHPVAQDIDRVLNQMQKDQEQPIELTEVVSPGMKSAAESAQVFEEQAAREEAETERVRKSPMGGQGLKEQYAMEEAAQAQEAPEGVGGKTIEIPGVYGPTGKSAEEAAGVFEEEISKEERVRQSPAGYLKLKKQLADKAEEAHQIGGYLENYLGMLKEGQPGMRVRTEDYDGTQEWKGYGSSYHALPWWQEGWSKRKAMAALEKGLTGKPFKESERGQGEESIWDAALEGAKQQYAQDVMNWAAEIEQNPGAIEGMSPIQYKKAMEVLKDEGYATEPIEEAWSRYTEAVQGRSVEEIAEEQGFPEEEIRAILEDESEPNVTFESAWQDLSDADQEFMNRWAEEQEVEHDRQEKERLARLEREREEPRGAVPEPGAGQEAAGTGGAFQEEAAKDRGPRSGGVVETVQEGQPGAKWQPSVEKPMPTPDMRPDALGRLRGALYGKKGRVVEAEPKKAATVEQWDTTTTDMPLYDNILNNPEYNRKNKGLVGRTEWVAPDEYLEMQAKEKGVDVADDIKKANPRLVFKYARAMKNGDKFPMLTIETGTGNQEGKHRALAAQEAGLDKVPVFIVDKVEQPTEIQAHISAQKEAEETVKPEEASGIDLRAELESVLKNKKPATEQGRTELLDQGFIKEGPKGVNLTGQGLKELQRLRKENKQQKPSKSLTKPKKSAIKESTVEPKKAAEMSPDELLAEWDRQAAELEAEPASEQKPTAKDKAQETKAHLASAVDKFKQINKILGEEGALSSKEVDESKWELIRPLLKEAWDDIAAAGKSGADFVKLAMENLSPKGRPYFERFVKEEIGGEQHEADAEGRAQADDQGRDGGKGAESVQGSQEEGKPGAVRPGEGPRHDVGVRPRIPEDRGGPGDQQAAVPEAGPGVKYADAAGVEDSARQPSGVSDYRIEPGGLERKGSWKETARRNLDIIELVKTLDQEGRQATPEEQALLAQYTGFGASEIRNKLFPGYAERGKIVEEWADEKWKPLVERLNSLLSDDDIRTIARSTQYAHYTSEGVIRSIYDGLKHMGFAGGKAMEPGSGIASFWGAMPEDLRRVSTYTAIEMDPFASAVASYLYPQQSIMKGDFVKQAFPEGFFDLGIGNPPFSSTKILADPKYKKMGFKLHDYFFAKTIDSIRPGGMLVFVTSRYTMDKQGDKARKYLADRADLMGAIRLPQTAFQKNAGTEVVTDVLFLRKREPGAKPGGHDWMGLADVKTPEGETQVNEYYANHPEMVLGHHSMKGTMYGPNQYTVLPLDGSIEDHFAEAIKNLPENVYSTMNATPEAQQNAVIERDFNPLNKKEGGLYLDKLGRLMQVNQGSGIPYEVPSAQKTKLKAYVKLRDALKQTMHDQLNDGDWESSLKDLNVAYNRFVKKYGKIRDHSQYERKSRSKEGKEVVTTYKRYKNWSLLEKADVELPLVWSLEVETQTGDIISSPTLTGRSLKRPERKEPESLTDAMALSLDLLGTLDINYISEKMNLSRDDVVEGLGDLIFEDPSSPGTYQTRDEYLSGNVLSKLQQAEVAAKADDRFRRNVKALNEVQPAPLTAKDVTVALGAPWVDTKYVEDFAEEVLGANYNVEYNETANLWSVRPTHGRVQGGRGVSEDWGTPDRAPNEILDAVLNNRRIVIRRSYRDEQNRKRTEVDPAATAAANEQANKMKNRFKTWVWENADRAKNLLDKYNRLYNNIAPRKFDGSHLTLPGVSLHFDLYPHQKNAIWRIVQSGNTYLAHAVGAGKTIEMIAAGMEMRRLGLIQKPVYVVPKHTLSQFAGEFQLLYPTAHVMVADEKNFTTKNRQRFMAQAALNNPDAVIITHPSLVRLPVTEQSVAPVRAEMVADLRTAIDELENDDKQGNRYLIRRMEQRVEQLEQMFDSLIAGNADRALAFEETGFDFMFVDESHEFRKLEFVTNRQVKGVDSHGSKRALDLYIKSKILEQNSPGRSLVFASGTPITNTMGEVYSLQRFFMESDMAEGGFHHFDAWANMFGEISQAYERNAAGNYEVVERFAKFINIPELMQRVRTFMDYLGFSDLGALVKRPSLKGGQPKTIVAPMTDELEHYLRVDLTNRIEASKKWKPSFDQPGNPDPIINIITDGRLASIDMRYINPLLPNNPDSKLNKWIDGIIKSWKETKDFDYALPDGKPSSRKGATQVAFFNHGFGANVVAKRGFDSRAWVMNRFKEAGIPESQIAWVADFDTATKKEALFKKVNSGEIRILIGSAKKMGTGMNVQNRLKTLHYLDAPWYPSDVEQPHGRILRQGNQNKEVEIYWYATEGSYDTTMWQMVARKSKFIEQAFTGDISARNIEDISETSSYEMATALSSGDQRMIQLAGLKADIERLKNLQQAHHQQQGSLRTKRGDLGSSIKWVEKRIEKLKAGIQAVNGHVSAGSEADLKALYDIEGKQYGKPKEIGEALIASANKKLKEALAKENYGMHTIATVKGFPIQVEASIVPKSEFTVAITPDFVRRIDAEGDPSRISNRIVKALNGLDNELYQAKSELQERKEELAKVKNRIGAPFEFEAELHSKTAEAAALESEIVGEGQEGQQQESIIETPETSFAAPLDEEAGLLYTESQPSGERYESLFQSQRDALDAIRRDPKLRNLYQFLERGLQKPVQPGTLRTVPANTRLRKTLKRIAKSFNTDVVFWQTSDPTLRIDGFYNPADSRTVYLNIHGNRPLLSLAGHELFHSLKENRPDLYDFLVESTRDNVVDFDQYLTRLGLDRAAAATQMTERAHEELYADFAGDQFGNPEFWDRLHEKDPSLTRKLLNAVKKIINKMRMYFNPRVAQHFDDIKHVQGVLADVLAAYRKGEKAGPSVAGAANRPSETRFAISPSEQQWIDKISAMVEKNALKEPAEKNVLKQQVEQKKRINRVETHPNDQEAVEDAYSNASFKAMLKPFIKKGKIDTDRFYKQTGIQLSSNDPKDLYKWVRRLQTMQDLARNYPQMAQLFEVQERRVGASNQMSIRDRKTVEPYFDLKAKSRKKVDKALLHGDRQHVLINNDTLENKFQLNADERKGYWAIRKVLDDKLQYIVGQMVNDTVSARQGTKAEKDEVDIPAVVKAINTRNKARSQTGRKKADLDQRLAEKLSDLGLLNSEIEAIVEENGIADWAFERRGYVPHTWETNWVAKVVDKDGGEYLFEVPTVGGTVGMTRKQRRLAATKKAGQIAKEKLGDNIESIRVVRSRDIPVELFEGASVASMQNIMETATDSVMREYEAKLDTEHKQELDALREAISEHIQQLYLAKGWGRHLISRKGLSGFREDMSRVIPEYLTGFNAYVAKGAAAREFAEVMKNVDPTKTPQMWKHGKEFVSDMLGETTEAGWFKKLAGTYFLAADVSAAALNMTQNWTHSVALLRGIKGKGTAEQALHKAMKDVAITYFGAKIKGEDLYTKAGKGVSQEEVDALRQAFELGRLDPQFFGEVTGMHKPKVYQSYSNEAQRLMFALFTGVESWNRMSTFLAAYRRANQAGTADPGKVAADITKGAHFVYGKGNRPELIRKMGAIGNVAFTFMTYPVNNIVFLKHRIEDVMHPKSVPDRKTALKVLGSNLAYIFAFGGLAALPFSFLAEFIYNLFADPDDDWEKKIYENAPKPIARGITGGIPKVFGNDMSWRIEGTDILGAPIGFQTAQTIWRRGERGYESLKRGDYLDALFFAAPDMAMNPYKALFSERQGTGIKGRSPIKYTKGEKVWKAMGFTPTRESETWKAQDIARRKREQRLDKLEEFAEKYIKIAEIKSGAEKLKAYARFMKEVKEYQKEQAEKDGYVMLTDEDIAQSAMRRYKMRNKGYELRLPKYMWPYQAKVRKAFGLDQEEPQKKRAIGGVD